MAKSEYKFDRWKAQAPHTWAYTLYGKYDDELTASYKAQDIARKYIYHSLKKNEIGWGDNTQKVFKASGKIKNPLLTIKDWSDNYNSFDNWTNLNIILTMASNLETYLAAIIQLSLKSDPGIALGTSKLIDGIRILKYNVKMTINIPDIVKSCTMGEWSMRISNFEIYFGEKSILRKYHSDLEFIRKVRNEIGHAYGRDIEEARKYVQITPITIRKIKREKVVKLQNIVKEIVKSIDKKLLESHIGEFEVLDYYMQKNFNDEDYSIGQRAFNLKKQIGRVGLVPRGKVFCRGLIEYWDSL